MMVFVTMLCATFFIVSFLNLIRIDRFTKFMRAELARVSKARLAGNRDIQWPNVTACYDNFKWYDVFNYDFQSLMVYDQ